MAWHNSVRPVIRLYHHPLCDSEIINFDGSLSSLKTSFFCLFVWVEGLILKYITQFIPLIMYIVRNNLVLSGVENSWPNFYNSVTLVWQWEYGNAQCFQELNDCESGIWCFLVISVSIKLLGSLKLRNQDKAGRGTGWHTC